MIKRWVYVALAFGLGMSAMSCENQKFNDVKVDVDRVHVDELSPEMIKVRDYVPEYAVIAHRGSTFWDTRRNGIRLSVGERNRCGLPGMRYAGVERRSGTGTT